MRSLNAALLFGVRLSMWSDLDGMMARSPVIGWVRLTEKLRFSGKINSAVVSREADRWFLSISVEAARKPAPEPTGQPIGVDLGLTSFAALSTGEKIKAPRPLKKALRQASAAGPLAVTQAIEVSKQGKK